MTDEINNLFLKATTEGLTEVEQQRLNQWVIDSPDHAQQLIDYVADTTSIRTALRSLRVSRVAESIDSSDTLLGCSDAGLVDESTFNAESGLLGHGDMLQDVESFTRRYSSNATREIHFGKVSIRLERKVTRLAMTLSGLAALLIVSVWLINPLVVEKEPQLAESLKMRAGDPAATIDHASDLSIAAHDGWDYWVNTERPSTVGHLPFGNGYARYSFSHRGHGTVLIEGPAMWEMLDDDAVQLVEGRLVASANSDVSQPVTVFVGDTRISMNDGEYGIWHGQHADTSLIVFDGEVEISPIAGDTQEASKSTTLSAGRIVKLDVYDAEVKQSRPATPRDVADYTRYHSNVPLRPAVMTETVRYLGYTPESLEPGYLENSSQAYLIYEATGVPLASDSLFTSSGDINHFGKDGLKPTVDSYILHYDPERGGRLLNEPIRGTIVFRRPIRAVLINSESVLRSDDIFRNPDVTYLRDELKPLGTTKDNSAWAAETTGDDRFTVDRDRKVLHFQFETFEDIDQVRILVDSIHP